MCRVVWCWPMPPMATIMASARGWKQLGPIFHRARHSSADGVTEIPCSLIALFAEHPVNLTSRHALLGFGQQIRDEEPLSQWQMGVMKHGSHGHGELVVA